MDIVAWRLAGLILGWAVLVLITLFGYLSVTVSPWFTVVLPPLLIEAAMLVRGFILYW